VQCREHKLGVRKKGKGAEVRGKEIGDKR